MAKSFIDVVQYSPRTSLGIPVKTQVTNDSISNHFLSDWRMRETIVSGVSCAPTSRPIASLAMPHLAQKKSVCSALSIRDQQWLHDSSSLFLKRFRYALKQPWRENACVG